MQRILTRLAVILLSASVFFFTSAAAPDYRLSAAESKGTPTERNVETTDAKGKRINCASLPEAKGGVIIGYIVPCVSKTIENTTMRFSQDMLDWLRPTVYAFITLVVSLFGVRILQGGGQLHNEGILLLVKMTLVIAVMEMVPQTFVPMVYKVMMETQSVVTETIGPEEGTIHCDIAKYRDGNTPLLWAQMDCLVGKLYGFTIGDTTGPNGEKRPNMLLASSVFGMLAGFFFGGVFGAMLFLACIGVLWTMFLLVLRTVTAFLNGYLYASIMLILTPLFLPLVLLRQTATYFEPWWKGILGSIVMPLVIISYAMFAMLLYDKMLFADDALVNKLFNNELIKRVQGPPRPVCDLSRLGNTAVRANVTGIPAKELYKSSNFSDRIFSELSGANNPCGGALAPSVNLAGALNTTTDKAAFVKLFMDCVKLLLLSALVAAGLNNVQDLARRLAGSSTVGGLLSPTGDLERKLNVTMGSARQSFVNAFTDERGKSVAGTDFLKALPGVPKKVGEGIVGSMNRE